MFGYPDETLFLVFDLLLLNSQNIPVIEWNAATIDSVLFRGDTMYLDAFENGDIPHEGFIEQINVLLNVQISFLFLT